MRPHLILKWLQKNVTDKKYQTTKIYIYEDLYILGMGGLRRVACTEKKERGGIYAYAQYWLHRGFRLDDNPGGRNLKFTLL